MSDHTGSRIQVSTSGSTQPYFRVPFDKLDQVKEVLGSRGILYSVRENAISMSGGPFIAVVSLSQPSDLGKAQDALDSVR